MSLRGASKAFGMTKQSKFTMEMVGKKEGNGQSDLKFNAIQGKNLRHDEKNRQAVFDPDIVAGCKEAISLKG